jgi:hypothetical protein
LEGAVCKAMSGVRTHMTTPGVGRERRLVERSEMREGTYAGLLSDLRRVGRVLDMSRKGIAFKYLGYSSKDKPLEGDTVIQIFHAGDPSHIRNIPCTLASDIVLMRLNTLEDTYVRRLGGRFGNLTPDQETQLDRFIEKYRIASQSS